MLKKFFLIILFLAVVVYFFLFGKLLAYSPVVVGFARYELNHIVIYQEDGSASMQGIAGADTLVAQVEHFYGKKFIQKPEIFVFKDITSFNHYSLSKNSLSFCLNGRLFVSPQEFSIEKSSPQAYLLYELAQLLMREQLNFVDYKKYPEWLLDGVAMYSANRMGTFIYPGKEETYLAVSQGNFVPPFEYDLEAEREIKLNVKNRMAFERSQYGFMVDYLIITYGKPKFMAYLNSSKLCKANNNEIFKRIYGLDFDKFVDAFVADLKSNFSMNSVLFNRCIKNKLILSPHEDIDLNGSKNDFIENKIQLHGADSAFFVNGIQQVKPTQVNATGGTSFGRLDFDDNSLGVNFLLVENLNNLSLVYAVNVGNVYLLYLDFDSGILESKELMVLLDSNGKLVDWLVAGGGFGNEHGNLVRNAVLQKDNTIKFSEEAGGDNSDRYTFSGLFKIENKHFKKVWTKFKLIKMLDDDSEEN